MSETHKKFPNTPDPLLLYVVYKIAIWNHKNQQATKDDKKNDQKDCFKNQIAGMKKYND